VWLVVVATPTTLSVSPTTYFVPPSIISTSVIPPNESTVILAVASTPVAEPVSLALNKFSPIPVPLP